MKKFLPLFIFSAILFSQNQVFSQVSGCPNADFSQNSFVNWTGSTGSCCGINTPNIGIQPGQHDIMTGGFDPAVGCIQLPTVPPGAAFSARVGDGTGTGAQAARLQYNFTVTPTSNLIIVQYAVVLQDAGHSVMSQPRFEIQLYDQAGNPIPCTFYQEAAAQGIPGWGSCGSVAYKNWTTFGVEVTNYVGQTVTLDVATGDCSLGGHYGYAYVSAACSSLNLSALYCENGNSNSATLSAPAGFANYVWTDAAPPYTQLGVGQTVYIPNITQDSVNCAITSSNGCVANLTTQVLPAEVIGSIVDSNVCAGNQTLLFNTTSFANSAVDSVHWSSSDGYTDTTFNFNHTFPAPGVYNVELIVQNSANCIDTVTTTVEVFENPTASFGFDDVCLGQTAIFNASSSLLGNDTITNYWYVNNDTLVGDTVTVNFNGPNNYQVDLVAITENGCSDTISQQFTVFNNPTANFTITESCLDDPVLFNNTTASISAFTQFGWYYNNQLLDTTMDLSYIFNTPGTNTMTLVAVDSFSATVFCDDTISFNFFVHDYPVLAYTADTIVCEDIPFVFTNQTTVSTNETLSYTWESGGATIGTNEDLSYTMNTPGSYQITMTSTSSFGCENDTVFNLDVKQTPVEPVLSVTTPDCPGDPIFLTATAEPFSTISWVGPNNFSSDQFTVTMPIMPNGMGSYIAFVVSEFGCISDTSSIVASIANIGSLNDFDFPNVITANGDNTNDILDIKTYFSSCDEYTLYIFNRWGQLIFEQGQDTDQFQGKDMKGNEISDGVLFYKLLFQNYEKSGYIHLIR
ncbi:MAG: gliding motility-associated C-terminal domain-containing protein [Crocinitomicaceae bacterium]|nr:gliding motility-associated C-terminal domain-containing protein [Crocinitomicaceae bacterium]